MKRIISTRATAFGFVFFLGSGAQTWAQAGSSLPTRLIVQVRPAVETLARRADVGSAAAALSRPAVVALGNRAGADLRYVRTLPDGRHILQAVDPTRPVPAIIERMRRDPAVIAVEPDYPVAPAFLPRDPRYAAQWALHPVTSASYGSDFQQAWDRVRGSWSIRVAVVDTGILPHPDLVGASPSIEPASGVLASSGYTFISDCRISGSCPPSTPSESAATGPKPGAQDRGDWIAYEDRSAPIFANCPLSDSSWHGTYVTGIVASLTDNNSGIAGAGFGVQVVPVRALGKCGGYMSDVAEAIRWASGSHPQISNPKPARVVNLSLAATAPCTPYLQAAIDGAVARGTLIVAAAGNAGGDAADSMLPSCNHVLSVAATTRQGDLAYYSNRSRTHITLSAPGGDTSTSQSDGILSLSNSGTRSFDPGGWGFVYAQGTSSAAPHVAAAAALLLSRDPAQAPLQLINKLKSPAAVTPFPAGSVCATSQVCGTGILNARKLFFR